MALKYYSYSYSFQFPSRNIFGYSFVDFWKTKYIQIFVRKFFKIRIYLNICSEPYFNICLSIFNGKKLPWIEFMHKNIECKIVFRVSMSDPLNKFL